MAAWETVYVSKEKGYGAITRQIIPPETVVAEYLGQEIPVDVAKQRIEEYTSDLPKLPYTMIDLNGNFLNFFYIIVFMVKGLMTNINLPFLWYPCAGFNAPELYGSIWLATGALESLGLKVRAWLCDYIK